MRDAQLVHRPRRLRPDPARYEVLDQLQAPAVALEIDRAHLHLRQTVQRRDRSALQLETPHLLAAEQVAVEPQRALEVRDADSQVREPLDVHGQPLPRRLEESASRHQCQQGPGYGSGVRQWNAGATPRAKRSSVSRSPRSWKKSANCVKPSATFAWICSITRG